VRYYPYGTDRPGSGNPATDYRFTGQRQEGTIGLYDYGARFYDPLLGRFLSADTVVPEPGNPQALNRYAYVLNNPLKYTDPSGRKYDPYGDDFGPDIEWDPKKQTEFDKRVAQEYALAYRDIVTKGETPMDWHTYLPTNPDSPFFEEPKGKYRLSGGPDGVIGYSVPHKPPIYRTEVSDWYAWLKVNPQTVLSWFGLNPKVGIVPLDYDIFTVDQRIMIFYEKVHSYEVVDLSICWQPGKGVWTELTLGKDEGESWELRRILKQFQIGAFDRTFSLVIDGPSWW